MKKTKEETIKETKKEILKLLQKGEMATSTIAITLNQHYWKIINILESLESEGKIIKDEKPKQTFWKLYELKQKRGG